MRPTRLRSGKAAIAASISVSLSGRGMSVSGETATSIVQKPRVPVMNAIGSRAARLENLKSRSADLRLSLETQLSSIEDMDPAATLVTEKAQENAYQAALQAAAKILPPSLLDYLH